MWFFGVYFVLENVLPGIIAFGLLHGINPSHGWIVAAMYSMHKSKPMLSSLTSSGIIADAHFLQLLLWWHMHS